MKKETMQNKLADLLGLDQYKVEPTKKGKKAKQGSRANGPVGITEDQIQQFRAMQGISYFLQAPELFTPKTCPHCGENFLVSRPFVKFCSYTCMEKDLEERGLKFSKGKDLEALVKDVYEGNEPIWIRDVDKLQRALEVLASTAQERESSPV